VRYLVGEPILCVYNKGETRKWALSPGSQQPGQDMEQTLPILPVGLRGQRFQKRSVPG